MRKTVLVLAFVALAMVVADGVAWAATIQCPNFRSSLGSIYCVGTKKADRMIGTSKSDEMYGKRGPDTMYGLDSPSDDHDYMEGGDGPDKLYGGHGSDNM